MKAPQKPAQGRWVALVPAAAEAFRTDHRYALEMAEAYHAIQERKSNRRVE